MFLLKMVYDLHNLLYVSLFQYVPLTARSKEGTGSLKYIFIPTLLLANTNTASPDCLNQKARKRSRHEKLCCVHIHDARVARPEWKQARVNPTQ